MNHLSPEQIVDLADGCADAAVSAHAAVCETCRAKVGSLFEAVRLAEADPQPEPSPAFWPHLAARIGQAVRRERVPGAFWRMWASGLAPAGAMAVLVIAVGIGARVWLGGPTLAPDAPAAVPVPAAATAPAEAGMADDPSWLLVSELSAGVSVEEAEAFGALPLAGGVERALLQLDDAERMELAKILKEEMAPHGRAVLQGPGA